MEISKQRIIANALKKSEYDLASWPEEVLSSLSDLIVAALGTAEFIETAGVALNSESWKRMAMEKSAEVDALKHLIGEMEHGDTILARRAERQRKALCFYAHPDTYQLNGHAQIDGAKMPCLVDKGDKAREALVDYT